MFIITIFYLFCLYFTMPSSFSHSQVVDFLITGDYVIFITFAFFVLEVSTRIISTKILARGKLNIQEVGNV